MKGAINRIELQRNINNWLEEDMPFGDITSDSILDATTIGEGKLIAKEKGIICGMEVFSLVYESIDPKVQLNTFIKDGEAVEVGEILAVIRGPIASILKGERL
ncbi:MAG: nicotinate-nucleotide diphosphorylase (carboxylating), partial [Vallitaleaceae bacterium]|nr:nicotinate-nucleotide diphosphorylase (carboxylating) [Vallitaleaceae bacterium]